MQQQEGALALAVVAADKAVAASSVAVDSLEDKAASASSVAAHSLADKADNHLASASADKAA